MFAADLQLIRMFLSSYKSNIDEKQFSNPTFNGLHLPDTHNFFGLHLPVTVTHNFLPIWRFEKELAIFLGKKKNRQQFYYTTFYLTCIVRPKKFFRIDLIFCMGMCFGSLLSRMTKFF